MAAASNESGSPNWLSNGSRACYRVGWKPVLLLPRTECPCRRKDPRWHRRGSHEPAAGVAARRRSRLRRFERGGCVQRASARRTRRLADSGVGRRVTPIGRVCGAAAAPAKSHPPPDPVWRPAEKHATACQRQLADVMARRTSAHEQRAPRHDDNDGARGHRQPDDHVESNARHTPVCEVGTLIRRCIPLTGRSVPILGAGVSPATRGCFIADRVGSSRRRCCRRGGGSLCGSRRSASRCVRSCGRSHFTVRAGRRIPLGRISTATHSAGLNSAALSC
jgi:hypothetical protein